MEPTDVGLVPMGQDERLAGFAERLATLVAPELERATRTPWRIHVTPQAPFHDGPHRPSEFLDEAALRMVEGPYDLVVVVTDSPLSGRRSIAAGLASSVARVAVLSTRKLLMGPRGEPPRDLDDVEANGASLLLHLLGHALDIRPEREGVMAPWSYDVDRHAVPAFGPRATRALRRNVARLQKRTANTSGLGLVLFHLVSAVRNLRQLGRPVLRSRALFLPLSLPRLSTAAVLPVLVLIFTAEIWDVGINMDNATAWWFAALAVVVAAAYLVFSTDLLFPRKDRHMMTEHLATVNVATMLIMLLAMIGLLSMLWLLVMGVALFIFPAGLIRTWPTLGGPSVVLADKARLALFVGSIGTLTGALGASLESRTLLRHLALFREEV